MRVYLSSNWKGLHGAVKNWVIVLFGLLAGRGVTALALIVVARKVLPIEYGQYLSSQALASFLVVLPNYGMDVWLLTRGRPTLSEVADLWSSAVRSRVRLLSIWILGMIVLGVFLPTDTFPLRIMLPITLGTAFDGLVLLSYAAFRSLGQHGRVTLFQSLSSFVLLVITLMLPLEAGRIALFASGKAVVSTVFVIIVIALAGKDYLKHTATLIPMRDLLLSARSFMIADLATSVYDKADMIIVSLLLGSSGAGVYGPALYLLQICFLASNALFFFVVPILSRAYLEAHRSFVKKSAAQFVAQALTGALLSIITFLFASVIVTLVLGPAYERSGEVLRLLSPILFLKSLNFGLGAILVSANRQPQRMKVQLLCAGFNVLANLVVIVPFGIVGVGVVYVLSELILCLGYFIITHDLLRREIRETFLYRSQ